MRKKKLLTATLCAVLVMASYAVSSENVYKTLSTDLSGGASLVVSAEETTVSEEKVGEAPSRKSETPLADLSQNNPALSLIHI